MQSDKAVIEEARRAATQIILRLERLDELNGARNNSASRHEVLAARLQLQRIDEAFGDLVGRFNSREQRANKRKAGAR